MKTLTDMGKLFLGVALLCGLVGLGAGVGPASTAESAEAGMNPKEAFASYYVLEPVQVIPSVLPYPLPLDPASIVNFAGINSAFRLSPEQMRLLSQNGFVVIPYGTCDDIVAPYKDLKMKGVPIFVTTDTLLHLYHILFDEALKEIEEQEFFDALTDLTWAMVKRAERDYGGLSDPLLKEVVRRNVAYFALALKLLQTPTEGYDEEKLKEEIERWNEEHPWDKKEFKPIKKVDFTIPDYVKDEVDEEIKNIEEHQGFKPSVIFNSDPSCNCIFPRCYCEDYSQYVPRGHYTRSEVLKRYFKAMMWYGRMAFLLKGGDGALVTERDSNIATIQASLIAEELPEVKLSQRTAQEIWERIYSVTSFFVGVADDLTPYEYLDALGKVFGIEFAVEELSDPEKLLRLKAELAQMRSPKIYGGSGVCVIGPPITKEKLYGCLAKTKGMRFMGQRFVPDSYVFQNLVFPAVGMYVGSDEPFTMCMTWLGPIRCFPRGLDVMTILGSERAYEILEEEGDTEYPNYDDQLAELKEEFGEITLEGWNRNLYWSWLYSLKALLREYPQGYPTFMRTRTWQDRELNTALASWAELRHDTILYAKQSYTPWATAPPQPKPVVGYVEPVPEFYARMLALTKMTEKGLTQLNALSEVEKSRLESLEGILGKLIAISKAELENRELSEDDYEFIRNFGKQLDSIVTGVTARGKETTIVADVHTDTNTGQVLEEGVGYVNLTLVAYMVPDSRIIIGAGPVFSYYEFKQPMSERLTDEAWRKMLQESPPERPQWTKSFLSQGK